MELKYLLIRKDNKGEQHEWNETLIDKTLNLLNGIIRFILNCKVIIFGENDVSIQ